MNHCIHLTIANSVKFAWQKWINKTKERDAAYRKKLVRILLLVSLLLVISAVVWLLTVNK